MAFNNDKKTQRANSTKAEELRDDVELRSEDGDFEEEIEETSRQFTSVNRMTSGANASAERPALFMEAYTKMLEERKDNGLQESGTRALAIQNDVAGARDGIGMVAIVTYIGDDAFWHGLMFESKTETVVVHDKRERRDDRRDRRDVDTIKEYRFISDRLNDKSVEVYGKIVSKLISVPGDIIFSEFTIVPVEAKVGDQGIMMTYLRNAEEANIIASGQDPYLNYETLNGGVLDGTLTWNPAGENICPITNLPIRRDFTTAVTRVPASRKRNRRDEFDDAIGVNSGNDEEVLVTTDGYVNLRVIGQERSSRDRENFDFLIPEIIATDINTLTQYDTGVVERYFIGLASMVSLENHWQRPFLPTLNGKRKLTDLVKMSTLDSSAWPDDIADADTETDAAYDFLDMVTDTEETGVEYCVLVRENGLGFAVSKYLTDMARGDADDSAIIAFNDIVDIMDDLTNKAFSRHFDGSRPSDIVVSSTRQVWGKFNDSTDRPLEDVDTWYLGNHANTLDGRTLDDFVEVSSTDDRRYSQDKAMSVLVDCYAEATGDSKVIKGGAIKLIIDPHFLQALYRALEDDTSKLKFAIDDVDAGQTKYGRRRPSRRTTYGMKRTSSRRDSYSNSTGRRGTTRRNNSRR